MEPHLLQSIIMLLMIACMVATLAQWLKQPYSIALVLVGLVVAFVQTRRETLLGLAQMKGFSRAEGRFMRVFGYTSLLLILLGLTLSQIPLDRAYVGALFLLLCMVGHNFILVAASLLSHELGHDL